MIIGDDVLIEYVSRVMLAVKSMKEVALKPIWKAKIEKFVMHQVWHTGDKRRCSTSLNTQLWLRIESRLIEMKERRKWLVLELFKKSKRYKQMKMNVKEYR